MQRPSLVSQSTTGPRAAEANLPEVAAAFARRGVRLAALAALALSVGGCSFLGDLFGGGSEPLAIYDLSAPTVAEVPEASQAQLLVPIPNALAAFNTERIVVRPTAAQIAYLPGAQWSDRLTVLVQAKLVEAFQNSGGAGAVGRPGDSLAIDYRLLVDIRAFEFVVPADATEITLALKLLDDRTGRVIGQRDFTASVPVSGDDPEAVVGALDTTLDRVLDELVRWTLEMLPS